MHGAILAHATETVLPEDLIAGETDLGLFRVLRSPGVDGANGDAAGDAAGGVFTLTGGVMLNWS